MYMGNGPSCAKCGEYLKKKEDWERPRCRVHHKILNKKTQKLECIDCFGSANCFHRIEKRKIDDSVIVDDKSIYKFEIIPRKKISSKTLFKRNSEPATSNKNSSNID